MKRFIRLNALILVVSCSATLLQAQPVNDNPCNATAITVTATCQYLATTSAGASNTGGVPAPPCAASGKDVWFKITVPASGMFTIETTSGSILDGILAVYTGSCSSPDFAYCDDDSGPGLMPMLDMQGFIPGSTALIRFYKKGGGTGTFNICVWDDNPAIADNNDCNTAQQLCTEQTFSSNSLGTGLIDDLDGTNSGCLTPNEHQSSWFYFTFGLSGEFSCTITPLQATDNYNFAIWGPDPICPLTSPPLRCSYSNSSGETGIRTTETELSEGPPGDGWIKFIDVVVGETYILMVDNYSESGIGFTFDFEGPPTISCITYILPITLSSFTGIASGSANQLLWTTDSEVNNGFFTIENSDNGNDFSSIGTVNGAGTSTQLHNYDFTDSYPFKGITYYRLKQTDLDGNISYSEIIGVENLTAQYFNVYPNPSNGNINLAFDLGGSPDFTLQIVNEVGSVVYNKSSSSSNEIINEELFLPSKGIFMILLKTDNRVITSTVINY
ncbi:MAG: T9SS type A sorting domain-containing protein [Chitinophagales bacterium]